MTATAITIVGGLLTGLALLGLRAMWVLAQTLTELQTATRANTAAIDKLSDRVDRLDRPRQTARQNQTRRPRPGKAD